MYESFLRSADDPWFVDGMFDPETVDRHVGDRKGVLTAHRRAAEQAVLAGRRGVERIARKLLARLADPRTLRVAWDYLRHHGGSTPGRNGHRYDDFDDSEVWGLVRAIAGAIRADTYRPGPDRKLVISKGTGRGNRSLTLRNIEDRVVERAAVEVTQPVLDALFDSRSFGFRPGRDRRHALALAESLSFNEDRSVWVLADLRDAFDRVPLERLLDLVRRYLPAEDLVRFVGRLLDNGNHRGLRQGGPLSPLLLNLYLHHNLDTKWRIQHPSIPLIRVADDLLLLCRSGEEARRAYADLELLVRDAKLNLKDDRDPVSDFGGNARVEWLGYEVRMGFETLEVRITERSWGRLGEYLALAHSRDYSPLRAVASIRGWLIQQGPSVSSTGFDHVYDRIAKEALDHSFDEIPSREVMRRSWHDAYDLWIGLRTDPARGRPNGNPRTAGRSG